MHMEQRRNEAAPAGLEVGYAPSGSRDYHCMVVRGCTKYEYVICHLSVCSYSKCCLNIIVNCLLLSKISPEQSKMHNHSNHRRRSHVSF